uniref:Uncharacterized protein n=1 Tax=Ditylenchus dipsaci TaxID=166011 RepID=A0A915DR48_9BILA
MFVPVVTKDMQLFPAIASPAPAHQERALQGSKSGRQPAPLLGQRNRFNYRFQRSYSCSITKEAKESEKCSEFWQLAHVSFFSCTLDPIHEGVPLSSSSAKPLTKKRENPASTLRKTALLLKTKKTRAQIRPSSSLSTASAPGLDKTGSSPPTASSSSGGSKGIVKSQQDQGLFRQARPYRRNGQREAVEKYRES